MGDVAIESYDHDRPVQDPTSISEKTINAIVGTISCLSKLFYITMQNDCNIVDRFETACTS